MIITPEKLHQYLKTNLYPIPKDYMATNNFGWWELTINQIELPSLDVLKNLLSIVVILQVYRDKVFEKPITITSGWRSEHYNAKIGGAKNSFHVQGLALDFTVKAMKPEDVFMIFDKTFYGGLELAPSWTHIDNRGRIARFNDKNITLAHHFNLTEHDKVFKK